MDIADITQSSAYSNDVIKAQQQTLGQSEFMTLLITQLKSQDPFEPVDNGEFVAQLAQFSSLEQAEASNAKLNELAELQKQSYQMTSLAQGSSLIGKEVSYYNPEDEVVLTGTVEALENLEEGVVLKIGDHLVPLTNVMEITLPQAT